VHDAGSFVAARIALGIAEAGYFPGVVLLVHHGLPPAARARAMAVLMVAGSAAGLVTGSLVGSVLALDGSPWGLRPWQWAFVATGLPALLVAALLGRCLPARLDVAAPAATPRRPRLDRRRLLGCGLTLAALQAALYGLLFWLPTWLQQAGLGDLRLNGWCQAVPHLLALPALFAVARTVRQARHGARWTACASLVAAAACATLGLALATDRATPLLLLAAASVAVAALTSALAAFWVFAAEAWGPAHAQGIAIGLVNGLGAIGSFVGPVSIGAAMQADATRHLPLAGTVVALAMAAALVRPSARAPAGSGAHA